MLQIIAVIGSIVLGLWVFVPFFVGNAHLNQKVNTTEVPRYTMFNKGDLVELTEGAQEFLGLELVEEFGKGSFEVMAVGEADEMLRHVHPQFLLLRKRRDVMLVRKNGVNVKFSGSHLQRRKSSESAKLAKTLARV